MVVNLAIKDDPDIAVLVGQRLVTGLHINDAEPAHSKADVLFNEEPFIVGTAMDDAAVHARERVALHAPVAIHEENSADSTHGLSSLNL